MHRFYAQIFWPHGLKHKFFDPMDWSKPGFPIHQKLPKLAQTHIHPWWTWFGDAIQPPQPLPSPSPPAFNLSQHQALFQWVKWHQMGKVLELQLQHQSFQRIFRTDFLYDWLVGSPCNPRDSQESSLTPQFKSINSLVLSFLCSPTVISIHDYWKNHNFDYTDFCCQSVVSLLFIILSRLIIAFLPGSIYVLIS